VGNTSSWVWCYLQGTCQVSGLLGNMQVERLNIDRLISQIKTALPGKKAHLQMMSGLRREQLLLSPNAQTRQSAVLLALYPHEGEWYFPLILRPTYSGVHSGQMAFPGGRWEEQDEDLTQTALREAWEEIGLPSEGVSVLGQLTPLFIHASNFLLTPVVGALSCRPSFLPDQKEVARIFEVPVRELFREGVIGETQVQAGENLRLKVPYFDIGSQVVWGATAMVLSEFRMLLEETWKENQPS
jgi:8-oxo-dGTP pyrophosphatase MutT (NUDIX family)